MIFHSTPTYMTDYPFIVMAPRSRLIRVEAKKFSNALSRALSLHPNKFLKTQFARRMDLVSAQEEAKKKSQKSGHKQFVILLKSGDFEVENALSIEPKMDIYSVWHKGKKVEGATSPKIKLSPQDEEESPVAKAPKRAELPTKKEMVKEVKQSTKEAVEKASRKMKPGAIEEAVKEISQNKKHEIMKTETKKSSAKKVAAKKPDMSVAHKTAPKKGAKVTPTLKTVEGTKKSITIQSILDHMKKGYSVYRQSAPNNNGLLSSKRIGKYKNKEGVMDVILVK